jgi:hypothetical protein
MAATLSGSDSDSNSSVKKRGEEEEVQEGKKARKSQQWATGMRSRVGMGFV